MTMSAEKIPHRWNGDLGEISMILQKNEKSTFYGAYQGNFKEYTSKIIFYFESE